MHSISDLKLRDGEEEEEEREREGRGEVGEGEGRGGGGGREEKTSVIADNLVKRHAS